MYRGVGIFAFAGLLVLSGCSIADITAQPDSDDLAAIEAVSSGYPQGTEIQVSEPLSLSEVQEERALQGKSSMRRSVQKRWEQFLGQLEPDDKLVGYSRVCGVLCGDEGYAIIREGQVVAQYQTMEY
jgi:hypothetical protein